MGEPFARYRLYPAYKANRRTGKPARKTDRKQCLRTAKPDPKPLAPDLGPLFATTKGKP